MRPRRRTGARIAVLTVLLAVLGPLAVVASATSADAAGLNLKRGSKGTLVHTLETRLARIGYLTPSAVDRRYRAATVRAVKRFQRAHGLRVNGRTTWGTWNGVYAAYRKAVAPAPAPPLSWRAPAWAAPAVTAHRGGASEAPENTLASVKHGVAVGADLVEFDLRSTADNRLVLMHDSDLSRTTNCSGTVSSRTLAQLSTCRTDRGAQPIATFDEVAAYVATVPDVSIAPELKDQGTGALTNAELDSFVRIVQDHELSARTYVQSFDKSVFPRVKARDDALTLVWLSQTVLYVSAVEAAGADVASVNMNALSRRNVLVYQEHQVPIWTWTARTRTDLQKAWSLGVDSVGTDIPTTAAALFG